jgi:hypothetical protein
MYRDSSRHTSGFALVGVLLALALAILGCSLGTTTGGGTGGGTTGPTATPTPPPHALAWFQMDGSNVGQIWASVNDGAAHQVTHMSAPSGDCVRDQHWGPPMFSPDLRHILAGWGSGACGDGPEQGDLYVVDASTGAAAAVSGGAYPAGVRLSLRDTGWIDNSSIWWIDGIQVYRYFLGGSASTAIGTIGNNAGPTYVFAGDAVLRGNTLFYVTATEVSPAPPNSTIAYALHRFDMTGHTVLAGSADLGSSRQCQCSPGDRSEPGFDASPDGAHVVYQRVTPNSNADVDGVASSQFFYANADGSGASRIASYATSTTFTRMQISPNGHLVAIARALPSPSVVTASVTSAGNSGDLDLHFYTPDGFSYPVWAWDGSAFWASTQEIASVYPPTTGNVEHFVVGTPAGTVGYAGGSNPWYTIGS